MLNNCIKAEQGKILIFLTTLFFFIKTVEVKVIYTGGQEELTHTLKEHMSLNMEVKCKLFHTANRAYNRLTSARCFRTISKYNDPINTWLLAA